MPFGPCSRFPQPMRAAEPYSAAHDGKLAMLQALLAQASTLAAIEHDDRTPAECRSLQLRIMEANHEAGAEIDCDDINALRDEPEAVARQIEAEIEKLERGE